MIMIWFIVNLVPPVDLPCKSITGSRLGWPGATETNFRRPGVTDTV